MVAARERVLARTDHEVVVEKQTLKLRLSSGPVSPVDAVNHQHDTSSGDLPDFGPASDGLMNTDTVCV